ncbi:MAG: restriction endonuclease subunit S, partial [Shewanella oncorhynchi]
GRSIRFKGEVENCSYPDLMMRFCVDSEKADPSFIELKLKSSEVRQYYKSCAAGSSSTMVKINKAVVENTPLILPSFPEQKKIAKIFSTWDQAIASTDRLLALARQQKKSLMQQLFTGKKRFHEEEWKTHNLADVAFLVMGASPKSEAYNEFGVGLPLLQGNADIKNRRSVPRIFTSEITKECSIGDILLSVRAPVGTVAQSDHKACIGRGIAAIKVKKGFNQKFIYQWLLWFEPRWCAFSQGSTFESINSDDIKQLKIKAPKLVEQEKIATVLNIADDEIAAMQSQFDVLKQEKKALMQQLLTGKRRVVVRA